ncbi:MAG TPA: type II toxin-antitoxin system VapC family toxin [candidate division Zixibacteria bacterium]|nr:type II toxin-antitoxin system VapC family toxin [candidate division Zixibacteria bacterium]
MGDIKVFIDSNIILNHLKGTIDLALLRATHNLYTNSIVLSEVLYVYLKALTGLKSYQLKTKPKEITRRKKELKELFLFFEAFIVLDMTEETNKIALDMVIQNGLLPNDALILATCKLNGITHLLSFDDDFKNPCKKENIELSSSIDELLFLN